MIPVLFTTFNRLKYTKKTLPALIKEKEGSIYVVDNGSTDGTQDYLKGLKLKHLILQDHNHGITEVMNWFFRETIKDEWIAKVDNDTLMPQNWLKEMIDVAVKNKIDILQAKHYFISQKYSDWNDLEKKEGVTANLITRPVIGGSGIVIRRAAINDYIDRNGLIFGWGVYQINRPEIKKAFYNGVWANLLDMQDYNLYAKDADMEYFVKTGRMIAYNRYTGEVVNNRYKER